MHIVIHAGAHASDEGLILACLRASAPALGAVHVALGDPAVFRPRLNEALKRHRGSAIAPDDESALVTAICPPGHVERLVLSDAALLGPPARMVEKGRLYPAAPARLQALRQLFPRHPVSLAIGLRRPDRMLARARRAGERGGADAPPTESAAQATLRWSDMLRALRERVPDSGLTVWRHEDLPRCHHEVMEALAGPAAAALADAAEPILGGRLSPAGARVFARYLARTPAHDRASLERIAAIFAARYPPDPVAGDDRGGGPCGQPYAPDATMAAQYDGDIDTVARMEGVRLLQPAVLR